MAKAAKEPRIPIAQDPAKLSVPAARLMGRLTDRRLCRQFVADERIPRGIVFFLEPGGGHADHDAAEELIRKGRVRPAADGLFGEADSQTWVA